MPINEAFLLPVIKNAAIVVAKILGKQIMKTDTPLDPALHKAALQATEDFFQKYGEEYGTSQNWFLARQDNWEKIFRSLFLSSKALSADHLDPRGFDVKPATKEVIEYFLECLQSRVNEDFALESHFALKGHIQEQTEVSQSVKEMGMSLLNVDEGVRQNTQVAQESLQVAQENHRLLQTLVTQISAPAYDLEKEKDAFYDEQIDTYREFLLNNQPSVAIAILESLRAKQWDNLSDRLRFRVLTNIGAARIKLGRDVVAGAQELLQAEVFAPSDKKALCNSAQAYWILKDLAAARKKVDEAILRYPDDPEPYKVLLVTLDGQKECSDPFPLIPEKVLNDPELCMQVGFFFDHRKNTAESHRWFAKAYELDKQHLEIQDTYATSLIAAILEDPSVVIGRQITAEHRKLLEESREILSHVWNKVRNTEISYRNIHTVINLSNLLRLLGDPDGAIALIHDAVQKHGDNFELKKQLCICLIAASKHEEAYNVLKNLTDDAFPQKLFAEAEVLAVLHHQEEALSKIEVFLNNDTVENPEAKAAGEIFRVQLLENVRGSDEALAAALQLVEREPEYVPYLVLVSDVLSGQGKRNEAVDWAQKALTVCKDGPRFIDILPLADTYYRLGVYSTAAELYKRLLSTYEDTQSLRRLFSSYLSADNRADALDLLKKLPDHVISLPFYAKCTAQVYFRLGDLKTSLSYIERCIEQSPDDMDLHLNRIALLEKMGKGDVAREALLKMEHLKSTSPTSMNLAHAYARYGMPEEALSLGYDTLRKFDSEPRVHLGYCGLILFALKDICVIDQVRLKQEVAVHTAFTCLLGTGKSRTYIIEPDIIQSAPDEIRPDSFIAQRAIGLHVGDTFPIADSPAGQQMAQITEVKHKYLHALHKTMEDFQYRFPGVPGMWMFSLRSSDDGGLDIQPLLAMASKRGDAIHAIEDMYSKHPLPLALVAHHVGSHPIDCFLGMSRDVQIKCCDGNPEERNTAINAVRTARNGFAIDPFSLYTLKRLNLLDFLLTVAEGKVGITQSSLDLFEQLIAERKGSGPWFSVGKRHGEFYREEYSEEQITLSLQIFEDLISWCRKNCQIIPAIGIPGIGEEAKHLFSELHPVFLDTLLAASCTERVLISDDLHYRQVGEQFFSVKGVWTQPLLMASLDRLPARLYHESVLDLVKMNYLFISFSADDLMYQLAKNHFEINQDFRTIVKLLGAPTTTLESAVLVASNFLCMLVKEVRLPQMWEKPTYAMLTYLTSHPGATHARIYRALVTILARGTFIFDAIQASDFRELQLILERWRRGHFVTL